MSRNVGYVVLFLCVSLLLLSGCGDSRKVKLAKSYYDQGVMDGEAGKLDKALADFDHAIKLRSDFADAYSARGSVYEQRGEIDKIGRAHV